MSTEAQLLENSFTLYEETELTDSSASDESMGDMAFMKQVADMWSAGEPTFKRLAMILNADNIRYGIKKARPVEIMGIRHEIAGVNNFIALMEKYKGEYDRRIVQIKQEQENAPNESPPEDVQEGSL